MTALLCVALAVLVWPGGTAVDRLRGLVEVGGGVVGGGVVGGAPSGRAVRHGPVAAAARVAARLPEGLLAPLVAGVVGVVIGGPLHAAAAALLAATLTDLRRRGRRHRDLLRTLGTWERSLDDLASALRAGSGPEDALDRAADGAASADEATGGTGCGVVTRLRAAHSHARLGGDVAAALRAGPDDPVAEDLAGAWLLATRHGVPLAAAVDGLRADVGARRERAVRVDASLAGPRATAMILTALPLFGMLLGSGFGADPLGVLVTGALGGVLCLAGAGFLAAGLLWTDRIIDGARR